MPPDRELRRCARLRLHWPVRLCRYGEARSVEGRTQNLSSQGFYCIAKEPFAVGERLECEVEFPPQWGAREVGTAVSLRCVAHVVRVEANHMLDGFGVACQIEDYALRCTGSHSPSSARVPVARVPELVE